jgi:uracil-DNA glycosylase family protein
MQRSPVNTVPRQSGDVKAERAAEKRGIDKAGTTRAGTTKPGKNGTARPLIPPKPTLPMLRAAAANCKACELWKTGTQTVFGEGPASAKIMFVGEQPGDREDRTGSPFVGPAGLLLDRALSEAGINRAETYVTNAVKHFKWEPRGKRRIHKKPRASEIEACKPWLEAEITVVKPQLVVCLGATAAQALLGRTFSVTRQRGEVLESKLAGRVMATVHPSSLLRLTDETDRHQQTERFIQDLRIAAQAIK